MRVLGGAVYNYRGDGTLLGSRQLTSETRELSDLGYDFTVDANGLVRSAQKVLVGAFDKQFTPAYLYFTFDYDENKNLVKVENYSNEGELIKTVDFTYLPNTEPTPNIAGFMLITEKHFKQVFMTN